MKIKGDPRFPYYWAAEQGLIGTMRDVVEVTYVGRVFYLDDDHGQGWAKVLAGGGPEWGHKGIEPDGEVLLRD